MGSGATLARSRMASASMGVAMLTDARIVVRSGGLQTKMPPRRMAFKAAVGLASIPLRQFGEKDRNCESKVIIRQSG